MLSLSDEGSRSEVSSTGNEGGRQTEFGDYKESIHFYETLRVITNVISFYFESCSFLFPNWKRKRSRNLLILHEHFEFEQSTATPCSTIGLWHQFAAWGVIP